MDKLFQLLFRPRCLSLPCLIRLLLRCLSLRRRLPRLRSLSSFLPLPLSQLPLLRLLFSNKISLFSLLRLRSKTDPSPMLNPTRLSLPLPLLLPELEHSMTSTRSLYVGLTEGRCRYSQLSSTSSRKV